MTRVNVTRTIGVSAKKTWNKLASFEGIEQFSPVAKSITIGQGVGATRSCFLPDDSEIKEVLTKLDSDNMHFEYKITSGPFPVSNYVSNVIVKAVDTSSCEISWSCEFENGEAPEQDMIALFEGFYNAMMEGLEVIL